MSDHAKKKNNLSIIIPWYNRKELKTTLLKNMDAISKSDLELVIVNCGGDNQWLMNNCANYFPASSRIVEIKNVCFNKSLALNIGVSQSSSSRLFFLDADIILRDIEFARVIKKISNKRFLTIGEVYESSNLLENNEEVSKVSEIGYYTELVVNGKSLNIETNRVSFSNNSRSAPGLILLTKKNFIGVNGMNSDLNTWGWEDLDLQIRLKIKYDLLQEKIGRVVHLSHGDEVRNLLNKSSAECEMKNFSICLSQYDRGNYLGTYVQDVSNYESGIRVHALNRKELV